MKKILVLLVTLTLFSCSNTTSKIEEDTNVEIQVEESNEPFVEETNENVEAVSEENNEEIVISEEDTQGEVFEDISPEDNLMTEEKDEKCVTKEVKYTVDGESMNPLLKNGEEISVIENYYKCGGTPKRGDTLIVNNSATGYKDYVKVLRVLPGDKVEINDESKIILNGKVLKNSEDKEYVFSKAHIGMMSLYIIDGKLQDGAYFVLGDNVDNSEDSRSFGGISEDSFTGKVK